MYHAPTPVLFWLLSSPLIIVLFGWDVVWKAIAMWKAARNKQLFWFIAAAIINSVGILPILYIIFFQNDLNKPKS